MLRSVLIALGMAAALTAASSESAAKGGESEQWAGTLGGRPARPAPAPAAKAGWRIAAISDNSLFFVDTTTLVRVGTKVAFRMDHRSTKPLSSGTGSLLEQVDADCASRSWKAKSSFPDRRDGQDVIITDVLTTVAKPGTVSDAVITAACTGAFRSGAVADPSRYAAAYFAASGSIRERLDTAARTQDGSGSAGEP